MQSQITEFITKMENLPIDKNNQVESEIRRYLIYEAKDIAGYEPGGIESIMEIISEVKSIEDLVIYNTIDQLHNGGIEDLGYYDFSPEEFRDFRNKYLS